jgi:rod shape-determining protein MreC
LIYPNNAQPKIGRNGGNLWFFACSLGDTIGKISKLNAKGGGFFLNMEVNLAVDFSKLEYVYVVINKFAVEQAGLEGQEKKDE